MQCAPPSEKQAPWQKRTAYLRNVLLNSTDVNSNIENCELFSKLIKTECQISKPVQYVFVADEKKPDEKITGFIIAYQNDLYDTKADLPKAFGDYFNANLVAEAVKANALVPWATGNDFSVISNFLKPDSQNSTVNLPMACNPKAFFRVCGIQGQCVASKNPSVGDRFELTKIGDTFCSEAERYNAVLEQLTGVIAAGIVTGSDRNISLEHKKIADFKAFGQMPIISQVSGNVQGLSYEKYGTNLALPGICVPTSQTMMAAGLKSISPYSGLGNKFDEVDQNGKVTDTQVQTVRKDSNDEKTNVKKRYHEYAVLVDEMFRAGGGLDNFPDKYQGYQNFYNNANALDGPAADNKVVGGYDLFFDKDVASNKLTQEKIENNYQNWIGDNKGLTLQLLSSHAQPPKYSTTINGHSVTVNGFGNANANNNQASYMIVNDPWGVVSHIRFADYQYPNAGTVIETLHGGFLADGTQFSTIQECQSTIISLAEKNSQSASDWCENHMNYQGSNVYINGVKQPLNADGTINCKAKASNSYNDTIKNNPCYPSFEIKVVSGNYRMLTQVGNDPGYIGQKVGNSNSKTAAYVRGYMTADPWPAMKTADEIRASDPATGVVQANPTGQSCTALTQGKIKVGNLNYTFLNPIPKVKNNIANLSSSKPITAPCTGFKKLLHDGGTKSSIIDLFGTFSLTCANGLIKIETNSCGDIVSPKACNLPNAITALAQPLQKYDQPFKYYSGYDTCQVETCTEGFTLRNNKCNCEFKNNYNGILTGKVENNKCVFKKNSCGAGYVISPNSKLINPVCLPNNLNISGLITDKNPILLNNLKDRNGNSFAKVADENGKYGVDKDGYLVFKDCGSSDYIAKKKANGFDVCKLKPSLVQALAANPSNGANADGTCRVGFTKDYENKFCVSTMSSCKYGDLALGLMTFDPTAAERCRFMGCTDGATPIKWSLPGFKKTHLGEIINLKYKDAEVAGYYCTKNPEQYQAMDNVGIIKVSDKSIVVSPNNPYAFGYEVSSDTCQAQSNVSTSGIVLNSYQKDSTPKSPKISDSKCLLLSGTKEISKLPNEFNFSTESNKIIYNCAGPDSMIVSEPYKTAHTIPLAEDCLKNWSTKRETIGDCYIPNGKGRYDQNAKKCLADSCHPGFAPSFNKIACVDLTRRCYSPLSTYYLAQIQDGFNGNPRATCISTTTNDAPNDYIAGVGMKDWEFKYPSPGQMANSAGFVEYTRHDSSSLRSYLYPTINIYKKDPFPTSRIIVNESLNEKGSYTTSFGKKITSWDGVQLKSSTSIYGRVSNFSVNLCPRGQSAVEDRFGEKSCGKIDSDHKEVESETFDVIPCEWQLDGSSFVYQWSKAVWAKGFLDNRGCKVTTCNLVDPLYGEWNDSSTNGLFVGSSEAKDRFGTIIPYTYDTTCMTAPINEKNIILNNDFTLVRRQDDFFTCDVKTLDGVLLKSGIDCKAKDWNSETNYGWMDYMDEDWDNPLDPDPKVTSLAKLKIAIDPKCTATQKLVNHQCVAK